MQLTLQSGKHLLTGILRPENALKARLIVILVVVLLVAAIPALAQSDPWSQSIQALQQDMTGPIAKGLALVAIVVGGLMYAFGEGGSKKMLSGIIFGVGMALGAANFISWLFPSGS